jgi:hypothetical protein
MHTKKYIQCMKYIRSRNVEKNVEHNVVDNIIMNVTSGGGGLLLSALIALAYLMYVCSRLAFSWNFDVTD